MPFSHFGTEQKEGFKKRAAPLSDKKDILTDGLAREEGAGI